VVMCIYLSGLCAARVKRFNDIFTGFYARQWYNVTNDVTSASLTVEDCHGRPLSYTRCLPDTARDQVVL